MMNKRNFVSKLAFGCIALGIYLVLKYHDTAGFQSTMKLLFNPDSRLALPQFWQDKRMWINGGILALLVIFYKQVWLGYFTVSKIYRGSQMVDTKPPVSVLQAGYYFQQDKVRCLLAWIMNLCEQGAISLHYTKESYPWSLGLEEEAKASELDQKRLKKVFKEGDRFFLKAWRSNPNTELQSLADDLYAEAKQETAGQSQGGKGSWLAWLILIGLIVEIPFYNASLSGENPGVLAIAGFAALLTAVPAYVFSYVYSLIFTESRGMAFILLAIAFLFTLAGLWMIFHSSRFSGLYTAAALYPGLALSVVVLVMKQPVLPKNDSLLAQIFGYRKHLAADGYQITETDLPWTMALAVHSDIIGNAFCYDEEALPEWLKTSEDDVQQVMKFLHQSLQPALNEAVNGKIDSKDRLSTGRNRSKRI